MDEARAEDEPVAAIACDETATCECAECGPLPSEWEDTLHEFEKDPIEGTCSLCGGEKDDEIHDIPAGAHYDDPAVLPLDRAPLREDGEEEPEGEIVPAIAQEVTTGELTHVVLQWGSKYHLLRKGRKEGVPQPMNQPCFLTVAGTTFMALPDSFPARGIYKVEKLSS